jgi:ABC-2 type transport system permease protein
VDRTLIAFKFTLLRHGAKGLRTAGWAIGGALVIATWSAAVRAGDDEVRGGLLALLFAGWTLGAAVGPVLLSGAGVLRPDYFGLLPIERRALGRGLLVSSFVGVASAFVLLAFLASAVHAVSISPATLVVVFVGAPLTWLFAVTLSRLVYGLLGAAMRSKVGVEIAGIQFGLFFAAMFTGWMVVQSAIQSIPGLLQNGLPEGPITAVLDAFPSSWTLLAVESAGEGDWGSAGLLLLALAALDAVLVVAAIALLTPRTEPARTRTRGRRRSPGLVAGGGLLPKSQLGAVIGKEYRQWTRDPWRALELRTAVWTGIAIGAFALISVQYSVVAGFAGLVVAFMLCLSGLNLYGQDGTAVWLQIVGQDATSIRSDVRGRQWATLLVFLPHAVLISAVFVLLGGHFWVIPILIAALPALFGTASGVAVLISAVGVSPGVDPRRRVGPNDATGNLNVQVWIAMLLTLVGVLPTGAVVVLGLVVPALAALGGVWTAVTVVVGLANGVVMAWLFGRLAIAYLGTRMPDVYTRIRYGRVFRGGTPLAGTRTGTHGALDWLEQRTLKDEQKATALKEQEKKARADARR